MAETETGGQAAGLTRRDFLRLGLAAAGLGGAALALNGLPGAGGGAAPVAAAEPGVEEVIRTTCALCPSGCGLEVRVVKGRAVKIEGSPLHPLNQGVCCLRGQAALEVQYSPERLRTPRLQTERGSGDWKEISWDEALGMLAERLGALREAGKAHQVALVHGEVRGQMRAFLQRWLALYGSRNLIGRESLAEMATRQGVFLTQGINGLPVYDVGNASYVLTFGGNLLEGNRNVIVYLGGIAFMRRGRPQRGKLVAVHPRLGLTGCKADEWVPIRPGTYAALALGMANVIINSGLYDEAFVRDFTFGFEDFTDEDGAPHMGFKRLALEEYTLSRVEQITGVPTATIARLAGEFAANRPAVAVLPNETGEMSAGNSLYTAMAVHALNALVGSIDTKGGVLVQRFPDVKAWPETAPDEMALEAWKQPRIDGAGEPDAPLATSAWQNLAGAILAGEPYPLEAAILLNANPVFETPQGGQMAQALMKTPFVVSFAATLDESAAHADLVLPASTFLEVWGDDYMDGCGYAGVSLRRPAVAPDFEARDPGDVLLDLADRLGGSLAAGLPWQTYKEAVDYRLSGAPFDPAKLDENGFWAEMVYFHAQPGSRAWGQVVGRDRLHAPQDGRFDFYSRELFALLKPEAGDDLACLPHFVLPPAMEEGLHEAEKYPYLLVTSTLITMTNAWQGIVPTLQECIGLQGHVKWDSWVEINPRSAEALGVVDGDRVWVESALEREQASVRLYPGIWPNAVFMPLGQGHMTRVQWGRGSPDEMWVGENPAQLGVAGSEALSGQAVSGPVRVRIYKA